MASLLYFILVLLLPSRRLWVRGHGRLTEPASRASAWRYGYNTPVDYDDSQGFCGGFYYQYSVNNGACGICGDPWDGPRPHEVGGKYATGTLVRNYTRGQVIDVTVEITANHRGHIEFRICPNNNPKVEATQDCLNKHPLYQVGSSEFKNWIDYNTGNHYFQLQLPNDLTCSQCVLQWRYVAGNNWGICEDGSGQVGCGPQEEFRACADVAIRPYVTTDSDYSHTSYQTPPSTHQYSSTGDSSYSHYTTEASGTSLPPGPTATAPAGHSSTGAGSTCWAVGIWTSVPDKHDVK